MNKTTIDNLIVIVCYLLVIFFTAVIILAIPRYTDIKAKECYNRGGTFDYSLMGDTCIIDRI